MPQAGGGMMNPLIEFSDLVFLIILSVSGLITISWALKG